MTEPTPAQVSPDRLSSWQGESYEALAPVYDMMMDGSQYYANIRAVEGAMLSKVIQSNTSSNLLDLGCGTGFAAIRAAQSNIFICGVDPSHSMLSLASERLTRCGARFELIHSPVESMPLMGTSYDVIVAFGSILNHMNDWEAFFRLVKARSHPGSNILITVDNVLGLDSITWPLYQILIGNFSAYYDFRSRYRAHRNDTAHYNKWVLRVGERGTRVHLKYESAGKVLAIMQKHGFKLVQVKGVNCLASLCPSVVLSSEGFAGARQKSTLMNTILSRLDGYLSRILWKISGSMIIHMTVPKNEA